MRKRDRATDSARGTARAPAEASPRQHRRRLLRFGVILVVLLGGLLVGGWFFFAPREEELSSAQATPAGPNPVRDEAMELADRIVRDFPGSADAMYVRGLIFSRFGDGAEAVRCWQTCLEMAPEFPNAHFWIGHDALRRGEYDRAVRRFREALQIDPDLPHVQLRLGEALTKSGRLEEAVAVLERHVALVPHGPEGFFRLGEAYFHLGNYREAARYYRQAVEVDPECMYAYYGLVKASERLGQTEEAQQWRERFQELNKKHRAAGTEFRRAYQDAAELRRGLANVYVLGGRVYHGYGKAAEAEACWQKAAATDPEETESRELLFTLLEQEGRLEEALAVLEQLRAVEPENTVHCINLGVLNTRLERFEAAEAAFAEAVQLAPQRPEGYVNLCRLYVQTNRNLPEAMALARKAVQLEASAGNYFVLSRACASNEDFPAALEAIEQAIKADPDDTVYQRVYAELLQRQ